MKKLLLCVLALLTLCGCVQADDNSSAAGVQAQAQNDFEALVKLVQAELEDENLPENVLCEDCDEIAAGYGFKAAALHDGCVLSSAYALNAFEIGLFYARSEANVTVIAEKLRTYLDALEEQYACAAPETAALVREAEIITQENLCVLLLCEPTLRQRLSDTITSALTGA